MRFSHQFVKRSIIVLLASLLIAACGSESKTKIAQVNDAEAVYFSHEGRLFVAGNQQVYEVIRQQNGQYLKLALFDQSIDCQIGGLVQSGDYLYAHCTPEHLLNNSSAYLLGAKLLAPIPTEYDIIDAEIHPFMSMEVISPLPNLVQPNGLEADQAGNLYVADKGTSKIYRITLATPTLVVSIEQWYEGKIHFINDIKWVDDSLYFTFMKPGTLIARLGQITRNPDGSPGQLSILFERPYTVLDGIAPYQGGVLVTDYLNGSIFYWKKGQVVAETPEDSFYSPTSVAPGRPPLFNHSQLLVAEQGIVQNQNPAFGNQLSLYKANFPEE